MNKISFEIGDVFFNRIPSKRHFLQNLTGVGKLVSVILSGAFVVAGILVLFFFIFGGISLIASAGRGDSQSVGKGRQSITYAVIGFVVIFASYWIVRLIEVITGTNFILF